MRTIELKVENSEEKVYISEEMWNQVNKEQLDNKDKYEIVGKVYKQNCGDFALIIGKEYSINAKTGWKDFIYIVFYIKYPYKEKRLRANILKGSCLNPKIEIEEFVKKEWPQSYGEILKVLEKITEGPYKGKWKTEFQKNKYIACYTKSDIIRGQCRNPMIEIEFINTIWPQKCGDSVKILRKIYIFDKKINRNKIYYQIEYQKYPYKEIRTKTEIINGECLNPLIEKIEFLDKIWPQHCGDFLRIIRKTEEKDKRNKEYLWEAEFIKYPYKIKKTKMSIKEGSCINPLIEEIEFKNKLWPQKYGEFIKILEKITEGPYKGKWKVEFQKYPCIGYFLKRDIKQGICWNPNLPWRTKDNLIKFILKSFPNKKPTFLEILNSLPIAPSTLGRKIEEFNLNEYIQERPASYEEETLKNFIKTIYNGKIEKYSGIKEDGYKELDIYLIKEGIAFEFNGSPYHKEGGDPNRFAYKPIGYHENKFKHFLSKGILIFNIWDWFWFTNRSHFCIRQEAKDYVKLTIDTFTTKRLPQLI